MDNTKPVMPDTSAMTNEQRAKVEADHQTAMDNYVSGLLAKPPGQMSPQEAKDLGEAIGAWHKASRP